MGPTRRSFIDEYKEQAVGSVLAEGRPVAEVARNIGIHEMTSPDNAVRPLLLTGQVDV